MKQQTIRRVVGVVVILWVVLLSTPGGQPARARTVPTPSPHCGGWTHRSQSQSDRLQERTVCRGGRLGHRCVGSGRQRSHWRPGSGSDGTLGWHPLDGRPQPNPGTSFSVLYGVAAVSASNVWAVGWDGYGTLDRTLGWHQLAERDQSSGGWEPLSGISAQSASDIWAVGDQAGDKPLSEHWDGTAWHVVPAPGVPNNASQFNSVSVLSATDVWAVGICRHLPGAMRAYTLIEHWDGQQWQHCPQPEREQGQAQAQRLWSVAAVSAQNVWAVGKSGDSHLE